MNQYHHGNCHGSQYDWTTSFRTIYHLLYEVVPSPTSVEKANYSLIAKTEISSTLRRWQKEKKKKKQSKDYIVIFEGILSTVILCSLGFLLHCYFILHKLRIIKTTLKLTFVYLNSCIQHHSITVYYYRWEGFTVQVNWSNRKPHWICV